MDLGALKHYDSNFFEASHKTVKLDYKCAPPANMVYLKLHYNFLRLQLHFMQSTSARYAVHATSPDELIIVLSTVPYGKCRGTSKKRGRGAVPQFMNELVEKAGLDDAMLRLDADISQRQRDAGVKRYKTAYVKVAETSESQLNSSHSATMLNLKVRSALLRLDGILTVPVQCKGTQCVRAMIAK